MTQKSRLLFIGLVFVLISLFFGIYLVTHTQNISKKAQSAGEIECESQGGLIINDPDGTAMCPDGYVEDESILLGPLVTQNPPTPGVPETPTPILIQRICCIPEGGLPTSTTQPTPTTEPIPTATPPSQTPSPTSPSNPTNTPSPTPRACVDESQQPQLQVEIQIGP